MNPAYNAADDQWSEAKPTRPGRYLWRKDRKWDPIERNVVLKDGVLCVHSARFEQLVPLDRLDGGGSEWYVPHVQKGGV